MTEPPVSSQGWNKRLPLLLFVAVLVLVVIIRIRLAPMPLERDEGEYALAGQFIMQGLVPSNVVYTMKLPGVPLVYATIMAIFGQTATGIHLGLLGVNLLCAGLVLALARTWFDGPGAYFSAAAFAVLSLSPSLLGLAAHATHFVMLFVLMGCWLQLRRNGATGWWVVLSSGGVFGLAFLMKQTALAFVVFGATLLLFNESKEPLRSVRHEALKLLLFFMGVLLPYGLVCGWVWTGGGFHKFWFWTVLYAREYASRLTVIDGYHMLRATLLPTTGTALPLWLLGCAGMVCLRWTPRSRNVRILLPAFFIISFGAVCPGYYFRSHYFILLLPALALAGGVGMDRLCQEIGPWDIHAPKMWLAAMVPLLGLGYPIWAERSMFFQDTPSMACRRIYGENPFPESPILAKFLAEHTEVGATIAVLGSEPQICFLAHRKPATGYIYTYGLMELQPYARRMQEEMIREIETSQPLYLVFVEVRNSWLPQNGSDLTLSKWYTKYVHDQFELVGLVDIFSEEKTEYLWNQELIGYQPKSKNLVLVYKRKTAVPIKS